MKKSVCIVFLTLFSFSLASACNLEATLVNQDPYPAIPGEYTTLVFQVTGVEDPTCERVSFELLENYPISLDPEESAQRVIKGGTYQKDYSSYLSIPYKVRIDRDALDGQTKVEARFGDLSTGGAFKVEPFYIEVEDVRADFELHVEEYSYSTKDLTIEVLNIADADIEALTLEIPDQENIDIRGSNRVIVGDLDSNEYTTADFKADLHEGNITVNVLYTDTTGTRRKLQKEVPFNSVYFLPGEGESQNQFWKYFAVLVVVIGLILWAVLRRRKKKRERRMRRRGSARLH